ncbi:hypothetical protein [Catenibacterium mitsuokai]|uniref:hypothetical protein n=1 Tax=Catenibacterium mitsuokai TaxID=100886 RepID=UPI003D78B2D4
MKYNSNTRVLLIYMFLLNDIPFNKKDLEGLFHTNSRTIDRDISAIKSALSESKTIGYSLDQFDLEFDRKRKRYTLIKEILNEDIGKKEE